MILILPFLFSIGNLVVFIPALYLPLIFSMERICNIKIFKSACDELKVNTRLNEKDIERLKPENWQEMVITLQSFSNKLERKQSDDPSKKGFKVSETNLKLSIDQLIKEWEELKLDKTYASLVYEDEAFISPYEDIENVVSWP